MQAPPLLSEVAIFTGEMPTMLNQMKNKFSDFYFLNCGCLYLQLNNVIGGHLTLQLRHRPKMTKQSCLSKVAIFT